MRDISFNKIIFSLIVISAFACGALFVFAVEKFEQKKENAFETVLAEKMRTSKVEMAIKKASIDEAAKNSEIDSLGWQAFVDKKTGLRFSYPEGAGLVQLSSDQEGYAPPILTDLGKPSGYIITNATLPFITGSSATNAMGPEASIYVYVYDPAAGEPKDLIGGDGDFHLLSREEVLIGGHPAQIGKREVGNEMPSGSMAIAIQTDKALVYLSGALENDTDEFTHARALLFNRMMIEIAENLK